MIMGIHDVLKLARTPEERERIREKFFQRMDAKRREVDTSDIPEVTDFSRFRPGKPYVDRIREHNLRIEAERQKQKQEQEQEHAILTK